MQIHTITRSKGLKDKANRLGRGDASKGNYSGKGLKGQKARSGFSMKPYFEGGQTSIVQRMPKHRGFKRYYKLVDTYAVVNVSALDADVRITAEVSKDILKQYGYIKSTDEMVKILGNGDLKKSLKFVGIEKFTASATDKIQKAGGSLA